MYCSKETTGQNDFGYQSIAYIFISLLQIAIYVVDFNLS